MTDYYVDGASGADINDGLSEGVGNAWATIQKAADTVIAGDKVWVKASATYTEAVIENTAGSSTGFITYEGYGFTPGDNIRAVVDGTGNNYTWQNLANYITLRNFTLKNATIANFYSGNLYSCLFNILSQNAGTGFSLDANAWTVACTADGCTSKGFEMDGGAFLYKCEVKNFSGSQSYSNAGICVNCVSYNGPNNGASTNYAFTDQIYVVGCSVITGRNQSTGPNNVVPIYSNNPTYTMYADNVFETDLASTLWAYTINSGSPHAGVGFFHNLFYAPTDTAGSDLWRFPNSKWLSYGNVFDTDPLFTSTAQDANDLTPQSGSPLLNGGLKIGVLDES